VVKDVYHQSGLERAIRVRDGTAIELCYWNVASSAGSNIDTDQSDVWPSPTNEVSKQAVAAAYIQDRRFRRQVRGKNRAQDSHPSRVNGPIVQPLEQSHCRRRPATLTMDLHGHLRCQSYRIVPR